MFYSKGQKPKTISRFKFEEFQHPEYHHGFCQHQIDCDDDCTTTGRRRCNGALKMGVEEESLS